MTGTGTPLPWMERRMMLSWQEMEEALGSTGCLVSFPICESLWCHGKRTSQVHGERHADELKYQVKGALPFSLMASISCILITES